MSLLRRAAACGSIVWALSALGCGGDTCEDAVQRLCEKACECPNECSTTFSSEGGTGGLTLGFDSADDCAALFQHGCEDGAEDQIDGDACEAAVDGATCGDPATGQGLLVPAGCAGT